MGYHFYWWIKMIENSNSDFSTDLLLWWEDFYAPIFRYVLPKMGDLKGKKILELGCGPGGTAVIFAQKGAQVLAVDLSQDEVKKTIQIAQDYGVSDRVKAVVMNAENLACQSDTFDFVFSKSVLVLTDQEAVAAESARVLKQDGKAIFIENLRYHPLVYIYRKLFLPYSANVRYISQRDIDRIGRYFSFLDHREFHLLTVGSLFWNTLVKSPGMYRRTLDALMSIDERLLAVAPFLRRNCWITAMICHK
jgi:ubiquinone/menaquinone biosynthesis C-methylase UbiE